MKMILILFIVLFSLHSGYSQDTIQVKKVYFVAVIKNKNTGKVVKLIKNKKHVKCGYIVDGKEMKLYARR